MQRLSIGELEARVAAYDSDSATEDQCREHVELVRELFRRRVPLRADHQGREETLNGGEAEAIPSGAPTADAPRR